MSLFSIHFFRVEDFCSYYFSGKSPVETGGISRMTGSTFLLNLVQQTVLVAIDENFYDFLEMPAFLTLFQSFFLLRL